MQAGGDFRITAWSESETDWVTVVLPVDYEQNTAHLNTPATSLPPK